jgi:hypothetical protein
VSKQSKAEKLDRIVDRLLRLNYQLGLSFRKRKPFDILFELKQLDGYKGLIEFNREDSNLTFGISLLTTFGSPLHRFEISLTSKMFEDNTTIEFCTFTSLPYKRGQVLEDLKVSFTTQIPFETYIQEMVVTSCKRDNLLTPLVVCLERAGNLMELEKNFRD